jgi:hypothetical protein
LFMGCWVCASSVPPLPFGVRHENLAWLSRFVA